MRLHQLFILSLAILFQFGTAKKSNKIIQLYDHNWKDCLDGEWMVKFYAPWCPACKANEPDYQAFSEWSEDLNVKVAQVDITKEPGLSGRFMVTALPTFYHGVDGEFRRYHGHRSSDALHEYVESKNWKAEEPIWWLRHPNSIPMTLMSWLFKSSVIIKDVFDTMTDTYGLSVWTAYGLFAVGTIAVGLILGLVLVCVVDWISPPKKHTRPKPTFTVPENIEEEEKERREKRGRESEEEGTEDDNQSQVSQDSKASQEWETIKDAEIPDSDVLTQEGSQVRQRRGSKSTQEEAEGSGDAENKKEE